MSATSLRELIATFTIGVDDRQLKAADASINAFVKKLNLVANATIQGIGGGLVARFFESQVENAAHIQDLSDRLGIGAQAIREFSFAAGQVGVGLDQAARSLGFFERAMGQAQIGGKGSAKAFAEMGISLKDASGQAKPVNELLGEVADKFAKIPDQGTKMALAMQLFGREGRAMIPILEGGRAKLAEMQAKAKELGDGLGNEYYKDAQLARRSTSELTYGLESLANRLTAAVLPAITSAVEWLKSITVHVLEFSKKTYVLTTGAEFLAGVLGFKLVKSLGMAAKALGLLRATALETLAAFAEFLAPIAIAGALYLVFDDLWTLMHGGQSEIGKLIDKFEGLGASAKFAKELRDTWDDIVSAFSEAGDAIAGLISDITGMAPTSLFDLWIKGEITELHILVGLLKDAVQFAHNLISIIPDAKKNAWQILPDLFERHPHASFNENGGGYSENRTTDNPRPFNVMSAPAFSPFMPDWVHRPDVANNPAFAPMLPAAPGSKTVNVQQRVETHVDVHSAPNQGHAALGNAVGEGVENHVERANRSALDAVNVP